jgi:hypothetical protein
MAILTNQPHHLGARNYWKVLKSRLLKEGNETVTNRNRLKMEVEDGKIEGNQLIFLLASIFLISY